MFVCLLSTDGSAVTELERTRYAARIRALAKASAVESECVESVDAGEFVAFVAPALVPLRPLYARRHGLVGIGNVRLDHPDTVRQWSSTAETSASDLDAVLSAIDSRGARCLRDVLGDFALVVWEQRTRTLTATRDPFGVKTLFVGRRPRLLVLSSHLELVHDSETLDEEYIADFLLAGDPGPVRTIWADSSAVAQGSMLTAQGTKCTTSRFWDPFDFEPATAGDESEQVEEFRALFREAVRVRLEPNGNTWAELSGGLDSSSVVSVAETLREEGAIAASLAGTISIVDELGAGNERRYSDLVVQRFSLSNAVVPNPWPWQSDGRGTPCTDEPRTHYPFFARDRLICDTVRNAGAHVLLSGMGADHYLYGNKLFIADLLGRGHIVHGGTAAAQWATKEKRSFWGSMARDGVLPLLPAAIQAQLLHPWLRVPSWIEPNFAQRLDLSKRLPAVVMSSAAAGSKFGKQIANGMQELTRWLPRGAFEEGVELRFPFLYRPLVEFGMRLPPRMRARPLAPKWILREAMRGILPEPIRVRSGKGAIDARLLWGFHREQKLLSSILSTPTLRPGIIDASRLKAAIERATSGETANVIMLLAALSLETWLTARSRRLAERNTASLLDAAVVHRNADAMSA